MEHTREELKAGLQDAIATVEFEKADGTLRRMVCTLHPIILPQKEEGTRTKAENDEVLAVWDLELSAWRSFRLDSIKSISFTPFVSRSEAKRITQGILNRG